LASPQFISCTSAAVAGAILSVWVAGGYANTSSRSAIAVAKQGSFFVVGLYGNSHFMFPDLNNGAVADQLSLFLSTNGLDVR
jgi:hypothetical protein